MKYDDDHSKRKAQLEDALNSDASDRAQIATFGKVAYETEPEAKRWNWYKIPWSALSERMQLVWVCKAKAVLEEAKRVGWFEV